MQHPLCRRTALVTVLVTALLVLGIPTQTAQAQSKTRAQLLRNTWVGNGHSRGGSPLSLELKFARKATRASLSVYWSHYQKLTAQRAMLRVTNLAKRQGLRIKARFADRHPIYKYKSTTGIYCHIPNRDFLRSQQFRCKLQYSGWILMHRKGVAVRTMTSNPPARPPSLKRQPPASPPTTKRTPGSTGRTPGHLVSPWRRKPSIVGCWMKSIASSGARSKIRSLLLTNKGRYRWIQIPRRRQIISRGKYIVKGTNILLLNPKGTRGTSWRFTLTRCIPRRPHQPCLQLRNPQTIRRTRRGRIIKRGRPGTQSHRFWRVGTHPKCR